MRRPYYVAPIRSTPTRIVLGVIVNVVLFGLLLFRAGSALAVSLGTTTMVVVMMQTERQGWGPLTRSAAGLCAGVMTLLVLNHSSEP